MCRMIGGLGKPRHLYEFVKIARRDSKGISHPDGWGYAIQRNDSLIIKKFLEPIWERFEVPDAGDAFIVHARRARRLPKLLDHVHPHVCHGVVLVHNGNVSLPMTLLRGLNLAERTSSERLACLFGILLSRFDIESALKKLSELVEPRPSANFLALIPWMRKFVAFNYHSGDEYYTLWRRGSIVSSEPLDKDWEPLSVDGKAKWLIMDY